MGIEDRDWYRQAQRAKENGLQGAPVPRPPARKSSPNLLSMVLLWLVIGGILYLLAVMPNMDGIALLGMNALDNLHITQQNGTMELSAGAS